MIFISLHLSIINFKYFEFSKERTKSEVLLLLFVWHSPEKELTWIPKLIPDNEEVGKKIKRERRLTCSPLYI